LKKAAGLFHAQFRLCQEAILTGHRWALHLWPDKTGFKSSHSPLNKAMSGTAANMLLT